MMLFLVSQWVAFVFTHMYGQAVVIAAGQTVEHNAAYLTGSVNHLRLVEIYTKWGKGGRWGKVNA